jgi:hypothetical protein
MINKSFQKEMSAESDSDDVDGLEEGEERLKVRN